MNLRLPGSVSILGTLLDGLGQTADASSGDVSVAAATPAQLDEALSALTRGDVEYLILEEDERFLQVAGEGDGPYQVQRSDGGDTMHEVTGGTDAATMRRVVHAYLRQDSGWRDVPWTTMRG